MESNIQILEALRDFLHQKSQKDCPDYRVSDTDLTRDRCLNFAEVVLFITSLKKKSLSVGLTEFFKGYENIEPPTKSAFTQARYKLKSSFFKDWSSELVKHSSPLYTKTWKGFRVYGVDGSTTHLPDNKEVREEFGTHKNHTKEIAMARVMCQYDVLNGFCHKAELAPILESERAISYRWAQELPTNSLHIYDRGFASFAFIYLHQFHSRQFVIRCSQSFNNQVIAFVKSKKKDAIVDFPLTSAAKKVLGELDLALEGTETVRVRLLRIKLNTGEDEILITSLLDKEEYPHHVFKELYFLRWKTEVFYDRFKNKAQIEVFLGHKPEAIRQEFHATIFVLNLQNMAIQETSSQVDTNTEHRKHSYQTNYNVSLGLIVIDVADLFRTDINPVEQGRHILRVWWRIEHICIKYIEPVRPGRTNVRKVKKRIKQKGRFYPATNYRRAV